MYIVFAIAMAKTIYEELNLISKHKSYKIKENFQC